ncbi:S-layer homology domain-containing protein [Paenibacillus terrigena]|uniref:S-layer homology domain-containing protein n=1 Tax=Paenibacillus terrigena TaxID=369333 RepID=UPI0028D586B2|nr:S-layer homology domain-containing protein [Paenibacillus terrigena]
MKMGSKRLTVLILLPLLLLFNSLGGIIPTTSAESANASFESSLPSDLTDWILDEDAGYIYAISSTANSLYFIRLSDMTIEKTLNVGSNPYYLARDGHSLQIALSGATMIKTVDLSTQQISNTIITRAVPKSVAASSNHLFYSAADGKIYKYDKLTQTSSMLQSGYSFDNVALAVDELSNTLYAGRLSSYGGITAIDAETGVQLSHDINDAMEIGGPSLSLKHIFIDDKSVYFGGHQFNKYNLTETTGTYTRMNNDYIYLEAVILDVTDSYVVTTQGVYDKDTYSPLVVFPSNKRFALLDSYGRAYLAGIENWYDDLKKITRIDLTIPQRTTAYFTSNSYSIRSDQAITDWTTTDNSPYIYAIVASTNELAVIRKDDMSEVKKMFIGSNPREIKIVDNKVYVIFKGENHISVLDLNDGIPSEAAIDKITTKNYPFNVYPDKNNRILYNGGTFGGGMSVTSAVYTSVTDAVYNEKSTGIYYPNSYTLDSDHDILYGGDSSSLYTYNSQNFNLLERKNLDNHYGNDILLDDKNLYYGNLRLDANQTSMLYGTYPDRVIYARGSLVFSNGTVYDRDSFTKKYDLLMFIQHAYVDADHTIFMSSDNRIYKFNNFEEMQTVMNKMRLPANGVFIDEDLTPGKIDGYLSFEPPVDQDGITGYNAYFLDQADNKLEQVGMYKKIELSTDSRYVYDISQTTLPEKAVSIGVYPVVRPGNYGSESTLDVHLSVPIYDAPKYLPSDLSVTDTKLDINKFAGTVTWKPGTTEIPGVRYHLYFANGDGPVGDEIAVVNGGKSTYSINVPEKGVPEEAYGIGVFLESDDFISPFFSWVILEDKRTPAIPASSIIVHKNMKQADNVVVNNLLAGDIIRVYNEKQTAIIGSGIVGLNQSMIKLVIENIGNPGEKILLTRETTNRFESTGTLVVIPAISNDSGGGNPGGGSPGGGGNPGGGSPGGGGIGLIIPSDTPVTSTNGTLTLPAGKRGEVSLGEAVKISIPANATTKELKLTIEKVLDTQKLLTDKNVLASPVFEILKNFSEEFNHPVTLTFSFDPASLKSNQKPSVFYYDEVKKLWVEVGGGKINGNHISVETNHFTKYAVLAVDLAAEVPTKDPSNDTETTVTFSDISGHWAEANIKQAVSGGIVTGYPNGTFMPDKTVTRAEFAVMLMNTLKLQEAGTTLTFTDTAKIGSWAQSAVTQAVQAGIIKGYKDGTFRPETVITRTEMAAMLANALGQSSVANTATGFADDKDIPVWAKASVAYVKQAGMVQGKGENRFAPQDHTTRAEAITVLLNLQAKKSK